MGRSPCCAKEGLNKGAWSAMEDKILIEYIKTHGEGRWRNLPKRAGLMRCGKSCRLRWLNYLRPDIKRGNISPDEEELIIRLHKLLGNRWSLIAGRLPGRTDNEVKNYWNTNLSKRVNQPRQTRNTPVTVQQFKTQKNNKSKMVENTNESPVATQPNESKVVRTKAVRCTKVFIDSFPSQPLPSDDNANKIASNMVLHQQSCRELDGDTSVDRISSSKLHDLQENKLATDILSLDDFNNIGDLNLISDLLNSDFSTFCLSNEPNCPNELSPNSIDQQFVFPQDQELFADWLGVEQVVDFGFGQIP